MSARARSASSTSISFFHFRLHIGESDERIEFGENLWQRPDGRPL